MCKGPVAGRNLAHPASHSRKSKVYVTGAQEQEVEWYKTKARGGKKWSGSRYILQVSSQLMIHFPTVVLQNA